MNIQNPNQKPVNSDSRSDIDEANQPINLLKSDEGLKKNNQDILKIFFGVALVIIGLVLSFLGGVGINVGFCFTSSCSPVAEWAFIYMPIISLIITVPLAIRLTQK